MASMTSHGTALGCQRSFGFCCVVAAGVSASAVWAGVPPGTFASGAPPSLDTDEGGTSAFVESSAALGLTVLPFPKPLPFTPTVPLVLPFPPDTFLHGSATHAEVSVFGGFMARFFGVPHRK